MNDLQTCKSRSQVFFQFREGGQFAQAIQIDLFSECVEVWRDSLLSLPFQRLGRFEGCLQNRFGVRRLFRCSMGGQAKHGVGLVGPEYLSDRVPVGDHPCFGLTDGDYRYSDTIDRAAEQLQAGGYLFLSDSLRII